MAFIKGQVAWNKGKAVRLNPKGEFKKGHAPWNKGISLPEKFKSKLRGTKGRHGNLGSFKKGKIARNWNGFKKGHKLGVIGRLAQLRTQKPTSIEKKVYEALKGMGLLFETQKLINGRFVVDAYLPDFNLIIEADGAYWHTQGKIVKKDKAENAYLTKCGYKLLRLGEKEIMNDMFVNQIERMVN